MIERRYHKGHLLREIAADLGVSSQRVRQIEGAALKELRAMMPVVN